MLRHVKWLLANDDPHSPDTLLLLARGQLEIRGEPAAARVTLRHCVRYNRYQVALFGCGRLLQFMRCSGMQNNTYFGFWDAHSSEHDNCSRLLTGLERLDGLHAAGDAFRKEGQWDQAISAFSEIVSGELYTFASLYHSRHSLIGNVFSPPGT